MSVSPRNPPIVPAKVCLKAQWIIPCTADDLSAKEHRHHDTFSAERMSLARLLRGKLLMGWWRHFSRGQYHMCTGRIAFQKWLLAQIPANHLAWPLVSTQGYMGSILMKRKWPVPRPWCLTNHQKMQVMLVPFLSAVSKTNSSPQTKKGCSFRGSVPLLILLPNQESEPGTVFAE